jgi:hypothetical protein
MWPVPGARRPLTVLWPEEGRETGQADDSLDLGREVSPDLKIPAVAAGVGGGVNENADAGCVGQGHPVKGKDDAVASRAEVAQPAAEFIGDGEIKFADQGQFCRAVSEFMLVEPKQRRLLDVGHPGLDQIVSHRGALRQSPRAFRG